MMTRRDFFQKASIVSPVLIPASCATVADLALRSQYVIRTDQIMSALAPFFPFRQAVSGVGELALSNPVFGMVPDRNKVRIGLTTGLAVSAGLGRITGIPALDQLAGQTAAGTCQIACGLRYDRKTRGIYLQAPELEKFESDRLASSLINPIRSVINLFGPQFLERHPIHTLDPSLASRFLNSMEVQPGGIALKFAP
ncbi:MAG: hypothetical protein ACJAVK_001124 [Akkermansiaceae bacterium]|jgi:hypothetical protein